MHIEEQIQLLTRPSETYVNDFMHDTAPSTLVDAYVLISS